MYSTETTTGILGWTEEDLKDQLITKVFPAKSCNEIAPADLTPSDENTANPEEVQPSCPFAHSGSATSNPHNENDLELTDVNLPGSVEQNTSTNENKSGSRPGSSNENKSGTRPGSSNANKTSSRPGSSNDNNDENQSTVPVNAGYPIKYDADTQKTRIGDMGKFTLEAFLDDGTTAPVNVNVLPSLIDGDYIYTFVIECPEQEEDELPKGKSFDHIHDTASDWSAGEF